ADRNRSHWSTSKTPSYTKSVSWQHHRSTDPFGKKRRSDRFYQWFAGLFITAIIIAGGLWYMGLLDVPGLLLR
ncbi:hypothetical protein, partial [Escherichia coli]|uniref:hypothetical protein n=1 Tax=Escherichia coli TaxID=562 RepID=UPI00311A3EFA